MITIGIPTKNRPVMLNRVLASILGALDIDKVKAIEIWDGSEVPSKSERIQNVLREYVEVRHIMCPDSLVRVRRLMLEKCSTPYLYMIDDDTLVTRSFLDLYPFDSSYGFICPRMIDLFYNGTQLLVNCPLLPYNKGTERVELRYMDTCAVLLNVELAIRVGAFTDIRTTGEYLDASARFHKGGKMGLYEPRATVYQSQDINEWKNPLIADVHPFPDEFAPYMRTY